MKIQLSNGHEVDVKPPSQKQLEDASKLRPKSLYGSMEEWLAGETPLQNYERLLAEFSILFPAVDLHVVYLPTIDLLKIVVSLYGSEHGWPNDRISTSINEASGDWSSATELIYRLLKQWISEARTEAFEAGADPDE